jgi:type II secretory pathway predicted ATPase ExeA
MYEDYYGFTEKPFSLTPDPKFLFKSESHASAFDLLQYSIRRREGFSVITGDIGTGKTTLCRALLEQIDRNTFTALVLNPFLSEDDLLKLILQDFGVISRDDVKRGRLQSATKQELIETIYDFLLSLLPLRASAVLIIDEAQNLPMNVLEQIRILSNLETDKEKLLQVVLVGQLNLQTLLKAPQMRQLDQRVSIRYELRPLTRDEVSAYVSHRVTIAGGSAVVNFQPKALDVVHRRSGGIPRLVNLLCDRSLLAAYSARTSRVTAEIVEKAAGSLALEEPRRSRFAWMRRRASVIATATGATVSLAVSGGVGSPAVRASAKVPQVVPHVAASTTARASKSANLLPKDVRPAPPAAVSRNAIDSSVPRYTVLAASVPLDDGISVVARLNIIKGHLQSLGFAPELSNVDLKERGLWTRVVVGDFASMEEAARAAARLRETDVFTDAKAIRH